MKKQSTRKISTTKKSVKPKTESKEQILEQDSDTQVRVVRDEVAKAIIDLFNSLRDTDKIDLFGTDQPADQEKRLNSMIDQIVDNPVGAQQLFSSGINQMFQSTSLMAVNRDRIRRYQDYEMMQISVPEVDTAIEIFTSNVLQKDSRGELFDTVSYYPHVGDMISNFMKRIDLNRSIRTITSDMLQYGDCFVEPLGDKGGISRLKINNPMSIIKIEKDGRCYGYLKILDNNPQTMYRNILSQFRTERMFVDRIVQNIQMATDTGGPELKLARDKIPFVFKRDDQIVHFKLSKSSMYMPYGCSILESSRKLVKQLMFLELAMVIYRIMRAPERRKFTIEVGNLDPAKIPEYINAFKQRLQRQKVLDSDQAITTIPKNLSQLDDYFIPVTYGTPLYDVDTTPAGELGHRIDDVNYFKLKLATAFKIPSAYLSYEDPVSNKSLLSHQDARFARIIERYQGDVIDGVNKIVFTQLKAINKEYMMPYIMIRMMASSTMVEIEKQEVLNDTLDLAAKMKETLNVPEEWLMKYVMNWSEDQIKEIRKMRQIETAAGGSDDDKGSSW